jgi:hypothetical protein
MVFVGIDPGLGGGLAAVLTPTTPNHTVGRGVEHYLARAMPVRPHYSGKGNEVDTDTIERWLWSLPLRRDGEPLEDVKVYIERVGNVPVKGRKQGGMSMFTFGDGFGCLRTAVRNADFPVDYVQPQAWQKVVLAGMSRKNPKRAALSFVSRRFRNLDLKATERSKGPHEGIVDALCIAEYGLRLYTRAES